VTYELSVFSLDNTGTTTEWISFHRVVTTRAFRTRLEASHHKYRWTTQTTRSKSIDFLTHRHQQGHDDCNNIYRPVTGSLFNNKIPITRNDFFTISKYHGHHHITMSPLRILITATSSHSQEGHKTATADTAHYQLGRQYWPIDYCHWPASLTYRLSPPIVSLRQILVYCDFVTFHYWFRFHNTYIINDTIPRQSVTGLTVVNNWSFHNTFNNIDTGHCITLSDCHNIYEPPQPAHERLISPLAAAAFRVRRRWISITIIHDFHWYLHNTLSRCQ